MFIFLSGSIFFGVLSYIGLQQSINADIDTDDTEHQTEEERLEKQTDVEQQHQEEIAGEKTG